MCRSTEEEAINSFPESQERLHRGGHFRTLMPRNSQETKKRAGFCRKAAAHPQPWGAEGAAPVSGCRMEREVERGKERLLDRLMKDLFAMLRKWDFILTVTTLKNYNKGRSIIKFAITTEEEAGLAGLQGKEPGD